MDIYYSTKVGESQFSQTSDLTQNIKGYQMVTSRMKKGREDKMKSNEMLSRGIPGDDARLAPLSFNTNNLKGTFDNH
jgi:hypothetical protein